MHNLYTTFIQKILNSVYNWGKFKLWPSPVIKKLIHGVLSVPWVIKSDLSSNSETGLIFIFLICHYDEALYSEVLD